MSMSKQQLGAERSGSGSLAVLRVGLGAGETTQPSETLALTDPQNTHTIHSDTHRYTLTLRHTHRYTHTHRYSHTLKYT